MIRPESSHQGALTQAIVANNPAALESLFQLGIDPNVTRCEDGELPLLKAAKCGSDQAMSVILKHDASVTATDTHGNTALHMAAMIGNISCVHLLLQHGIPINIFNSFDVTPLMHAVYFGHIDIVRYLILQGASTTPELNSSNESALTYASHMGNVAILELLLTVEVPIEYRRRELYASLAEAALGRHMSVVQILLARGAPVNFSDTSIQRPLHAAICGGNESIVRLLLSRGANIEATNQNGDTPLILATGRRNVNMVIILLDAGADINAVNEVTGDTAFSVAEERRYTELSDILLKAPTNRTL
nr:Ankyrin repeat domain containing protein [Echinococcus granulosus]